jgi:hypothetical protein
MNRFAEDLKRARELRGISIQDISKDTRINAKFIEALEDGNYKILPQTYIRAFIRAYAKCVGLNPDEMMERYQQTLSGKNISDIPPISTVPAPQPPIQPQETVEVEDPTIKKLEEYLSSVKPKPVTEEIQKQQNIKEEPKQRAGLAYTKKRSNSSNFIMLFGIIVFLAIAAYFYFSPSSKDNSITENPFENVLKETEQKYSNKKESTTTIKPDSNKIRTGIMSDSLTLALLPDIDVYISVLMDNKKYDRNIVPANSKKVLRAKEKFIVTAPKGKHIKIYLDEKFLGNLSNSDSLKSVYVTPEGIKSRKLEKKPQNKPEELKILDVKPLNRTLFR